MEFEIEIENKKIWVKYYNGYSNCPTIIFLHDSLGCIELWRDFPKRIGEAIKCNVLVYDRQGYGKSSPFNSCKRTIDYLELEANFLNSLLETLSMDNVILFGHSDGGSIALIAAAKFPEKVAGIITEGAHIFVEDITLTGIRGAVESYKSTNLKTKLEKYHGNKTEALFKAWAETWLADAFRFWNIEHFLYGIKCPALIIQGENDEFGSIKQVDSIVNNSRPFAVKYMIPNTGHSPHKEATVLTLNKSIEFIEGIVNQG